MSTMKLKSNINDWSSMTDQAAVREICSGLRQMRLQKNISQAKLAVMSGVNRVTISRMEAGRSATLLTIVAVLRALDKLDILNAFVQAQEVSPLQLLKIQEQQRKRASRSNPIIKNTKGGK
jgi:transcriptional regulator with XRE-family HTH domain